MKKGWSFLLVMVFAVSAVGQERYLKPVDEAAKDASFLAFRKKLLAAAERRDMKYVLSTVDPDIKLSFGGHSGVKGFRELWKDEAKFWQEFLPVIKNGGAFEGEDKTSFSAPYTYSSWPEDVDGFEYSAIFGKDVNLRQTASREGKVVSQLSYNIVKVDWEKSVRQKPDDLDTDVEWFSVETMGGQKGFVYKDFVRSHIDYRAGFIKKNGVWKMSFFIAGD